MSKGLPEHGMAAHARRALTPRFRSAGAPLIFLSGGSRNNSPGTAALAQDPGTDGDENSPSRRPPAPCPAGIYPHRNVGRDRPDLAAGQSGAAGAESGAGNGAVGRVHDSGPHFRLVRAFVLLSAVRPRSDPGIQCLRVPATKVSRRSLQCRSIPNENQAASPSSSCWR